MIQMKDKVDSLRIKAEKLLAEHGNDNKNNYELSLEKLIEELNIFQIELQIQNEDLKQSNERIDQVQKRFLDIFNNAPVGFVIISFEKKILEVNSFFEFFINKSKNQLIGKKITQYIGKDFQDEFYLLLQNAIDKEEKGSMFLGLCNQDASLPQYKLQTSISYDPTIEQKVITLAFLDVSRLKITENVLKNQNEELKKLNQELDQFTYTTSHDLRAPLTSILGLSNLIRMSKDSPEAILEYTKLIDKSILRLDGLVQEILQHSRNNRLPVNYEKVDLEYLIKELYEFHLDPNDKDSVTLTINTDRMADLFTDVRRIKIVFNNLLSNSIRYRKSGHDCTIDVAIKIMHNKANITFSDNGIGIHPSHQDKIFNMFYRATDTNNGSGLGLYIVKEAIEKLNGDIKVQSKVGEGTTFIINVKNYAK